MHSDHLDALSRSLADSRSRRTMLQLFGIGVVGTAVTGGGLNQAEAKKKGGGGQNLGPFETLTMIPIRERDGGQRFRGRLSVLEFVEEGQGIVAVAQLTGQVTKPNGKGKKRISRQVRIPVEIVPEEGVQAQATCELLELFLGPIDLNLLGLRLQVNQIHIRLTAESAPGNLLGNLLCAIAGLLDGGGLLSDIVDALNDILEIL